MCQFSTLLELNQNTFSVLPTCVFTSIPFPVPIRIKLKPLETARHILAIKKLLTWLFNMCAQTKTLHARIYFSTTRDTFRAFVSRVVASFKTNWTSRHECARLAVRQAGQNHLAHCLINVFCTVMCFWLYISRISTLRGGGANMLCARVSCSCCVSVVLGFRLLLLFRPQIRLEGTLVCIEILWAHIEV